MLKLEKWRRAASARRWTNGENEKPGDWPGFIDQRSLDNRSEEQQLTPSPAKTNKPDEIRLFTIIIAPVLTVSTAVIGIAIKVAEKYKPTVKRNARSNFPAAADRLLVPWSITRVIQKSLHPAAPHHTQ